MTGAYRALPRPGRPVQETLRLLRYPGPRLYIFL